MQQARLPEQQSVVRVFPEGTLERVDCLREPVSAAIPLPGDERDQNSYGRSAATLSKAGLVRRGPVQSFRGPRRQAIRLELPCLTNQGGFRGSGATTSRRFKASGSLRPRQAFPDLVAIDPDSSSSECSPRMAGAGGRREVLPGTTLWRPAPEVRRRAYGDLNAASIPGIGLSEKFHTTQVIVRRRKGGERVFGRARRLLTCCQREGIDALREGNPREPLSKEGGPHPGDPTREVTEANDSKLSPSLRVRNCSVAIRSGMCNPRRDRWARAIAHFSIPSRF